MSKTNQTAELPAFKFQMIGIDLIRPNEDNPRILKDKDFQKMKQSILDFPKMLFIRPIVIDKDMVIIGGNQRFEAVKDLGSAFQYYPNVPVCFADDLTEDERDQFIIKDNSHFGGWDFDKLANTWNPEKLSSWGVKDVPNMNIEPEVADDEFVEPTEQQIKEIQTDIKVGDIFQIGPHRLMCGDSVNPEHVKLLMNGQRAELLFTSPPYADMRDYNGNKNLNVSFLSGFIEAFAPYCEYQCVNLGLKRKDHELITYWDTYIDKARIAGYKLLGWNVWARPSAGSVGNQSAFIPVVHEFIFVFGYKFKNINRSVERKDYTIAKKNSRGRRQADGSVKPSSVGIHVSKKEMESVFFSNPELGKIRELHPATFPVELPAEYIKAITDPKQIVAEAFGGSGTTMVAGHQLNRPVYAMELDPAYCQVIIDRMIKLDGNLKVIKLNDIH